VSAAPAPATGDAPPAQGWLRRLLTYVLRHRRDVSVAFGAAVLGAACQAGAPLLERQIVDGVIVERTSSLLPWLLALIAVAAGAFLAAHLRRYRGGKVALEVQYDLRNEMQAHLQHMDFASLDRMPTGQLVARASSDTTLVQGLLMFIPMMSGNLLLMVLSLGVMLWLSPPLALVSLIIAPALLAVSYRMRTKIFPATWDAQQREGEVIQIVDEAVNGVRVVKAFGQERRELERVTAASEDLYGSQMRAVRLTSRFQPLLQAIPALGQVAILAFGGWLALRGDISLGTFLAFTTYIGQLVAPTRQLAGLLAIGQQARAGVERIFQLLDLAPAIADAPDAVELPPLRGEIDFDAVEFGYDERRRVLAGIDLHVKAGERVAIVGPSGSGKTTATMLVSRFYEPDRGAVLVDGHDVRCVALASLRSQIGVVFEESFLFSDSVRANIAYGRPGASDAEIEAAARVARAHDFVMALPRGYDSVVGERGLTLSGGQRQRIALARAVLQDPRILILDDATSAVDARTEEQINEGLRSVLAGRTTLLVAHRRSTLHLADRVVVLDEGRVIDEGTHEELAERSAVYRGLLTGLDEDVAEAVEGRVEALSARVGETTASAWGGGAGVDAGGAPGATGATASGSATSTAAQAFRAPSLGGGLGKPGGVGGGPMAKALAPTPQLLAQVAKLRPVRDRADVDLDAEARHVRGFTLRKLLREFRLPLLLGLVLVVLDALAGIAGPVLVKDGIDEGVAAGSQAALFTASALFLVVTLADLIDEIGETFVTGRTAQRVMLSLRIRIWAQLQRLGLDYYEREMAGRIMTRMTTDVDQFESLIENGLLSALVAFATFFGVGVALLIMNLELGLATLTVVIPLALATVAFRRRSATLYDQARDRIAIVNADFQESLSGVREAQAAVHEAETERRFRGLGADYLESRVGAQRLVSIYFPFVQFLSSLADVIVLAVGAQMVHEGRLTTGVLIAFILYVDMFFSPIQQLSQVFDSWQQTRISVARIDELMGLETRTPPAASPRVPGRLAGAVSLDGVSFSYPEPTAAPSAAAAVRGPADLRLGGEDGAIPLKAPEALKGIELEIGAGETVALVGETGAGKSTLVKLLARFYDPDRGAVRIDGADLRELDLPAYRHQLGYVPQEAFLFTGTIRDNIAYGRFDATNAEVEAAARAVGAHDFIAALPGAYHHQVAERGRSLSAGERQLIALARAELVDPAILLLDEATSNLDLANEARVVAAMQQLSRDRTTVVIAHRLQTARAADRIVLLDGGRVAESGTHEELLARGGRYAAMWRAFEALGEQHAA
jgi:ATP-binding cassette subfamily B protein